MGFKLPSTVFVLDFANTELDGLTVKAKSVPFGTYLELANLADAADGDGREALAAMAQLVESFADVALRSWDLLDDDDQPVPATAESLRGLDVRHVLLIVTTWLRAASGAVPAPLGASSPAGVPSVVELPPMEPLSARPAS